MSDTKKLLNDEIDKLSQTIECSICRSSEYNRDNFPISCPNRHIYCASCLHGITDTTAHLPYTNPLFSKPSCAICKAIFPKFTVHDTNQKCDIIVDQNESISNIQTIVLRLIEENKLESMNMIEQERQRSARVIESERLNYRTQLSKMKQKMQRNYYARIIYQKYHFRRIFSTETRIRKIRNKTLSLSIQD